MERAFAASCVPPQQVVPQVPELDRLLRRTSIGLPEHGTAAQQKAAAHGDVEAQLLMPPQPPSAGPAGVPTAAAVSRRSTTSDFDERLCVICYDRLACTVCIHSPRRIRAHKGTFILAACNLADRADVQHQIP